MSKMADNENTSIDNTATESLLLNEQQANSTPIINSKVSLEDLFLLMKTQNNELREQSIKFDVKFDEVKKEIQRQNVNVDKRINEIEIQCDSIQKQTENNEQCHNKISKLDDKIKQINEIVQNQIETQYEKIENRCLTTVNEQIKSRTNYEINKQIEMKTNILQNKTEKCELDVIDITKHFETIDQTVSKYENNTSDRMSMLQSKIKGFDNLAIQNNNNMHVKCDVIENDLMKVKNELRGEINKKVTGVTERIVVTRDMYNEIELENKRGVDKLELNKDDKVSRGENCNNINKSMILENDYVNRGSDNEMLWGIEYDNNGMIVCVEGRCV